VRQLPQLGTREQLAALLPVFMPDWQLAFYAVCMLLRQQHSRCLYASDVWQEPAAGPSVLLHRDASCVHAAASARRAAAAGITGSELPPRHALTVSVPGAAALWEDAVQRWGSGSSSLAEVLAPAIELAEDGFPVGPVASFEWQQGAGVIREAGGAGVWALISEEGCGPKPGQIWRNADLAATLRRLAEHGAAKGGVAAARVVGSSLLHGGLIGRLQLNSTACRSCSILSMSGWCCWGLHLCDTACCASCHLHLLQPAQCAVLALCSSRLSAVASC
jgi:hypothetical protein